MLPRLVYLFLLFAACVRGEAISTASSAVVAAPPRERFHLYLLLGQSNMVGRDTSTLCAQGENPRVLSLNGDDQWVIAREPMHVRGTGVGPGIPFALEMLKAEPGITIGLVPCAVGGTSLSHWLKGGDLYARTLERARCAAEHGVLKGILWHQGEADATSQAGADTYADRLAGLLRDLRQDLALPELPVVVGQLGTFLPSERFPHADTIRDALRHVSANVPHAALADSTGLADKGDKVHFSAEAQRELGTRYAVAMRQLEAPVPTTPPSTAVATTTIDLWPAGTTPGNVASEPEGELPARGDGVHRITNISRPTLAVFPAPRANAPTPALIVCPGGGYSYIVVDKEGTEVAGWLNAAGLTALVLKYRVPANREGAIQDLQRAFRLTRAHASEWNIDPARVGVIGFSAGGNLAARASTLLDQRTYPVLDEADHQSCRPDFAILVYPAYLEAEGQIARDLDVKPQMAPTLIVHNEDDKAFVAGSKVYHVALDQVGAPNQLLLYPTGGHGYGLRCTRDARVWPEAALAWLRNGGVLTGAAPAAR